MESVTSEEDSFIILGNSSPQTSLDAALMESKIMQCSKSSKSASESGNSDTNAMSNGNTDLSKSYSSATGDNWVPDFKPFISEETMKYNGSTMINSAISSDMAFMGDIESKVADLLKENIILKQTLAKNNTQMKDQFNNIAKWQEDMMNTHQLHKIKFGETKVLIEKLRMEKAELKKKLDHECELNEEYRKQIDQLAIKLQIAEKEIASVKCDCDTLKAEKDKLSKDIVDVNKILVAKISKLEEAVKENNEMHEQLKNLKEVNSNTEAKKVESGDDMCVSSLADSFIMAENVQQSSKSHLEEDIERLTRQLEMVERQRRQVILENDKICNEKEILEEGAKKLAQENSDLKLVIRGIEEKLKKSNVEKEKSLQESISSLKQELKTAQEKLFEAKNKKTDNDQHTSEMENKVKQLSENVADLTERLREALTITFQPVRYSLSLESQADSSEFSNFVENVKLYDKTLKELAQNLNQHSHLYKDVLEKIYAWLMDVQQRAAKMKGNELLEKQQEKFMALKETLNEYNGAVSKNNQQVKSSLSFFEKLFLDYQQVLKVNKDYDEKSADIKEKLSSYDHLVAKNVQNEYDLSKEKRERQMLVDIVKTLQKESEERDLLRAQMEVYKTDFETERESRTCLAAEKEELLSTVQDLQNQIQTLVTENSQLRSSRSSPSSSSSTPRPTSSGFVYSNTKFEEVYTCPKCNLHTLDYLEMDRHLVSCLELKE